MFNSDSKRCQRAPPSSYRFLFCLIILPRSVPFRVIESMGLADFKLRFFFERQLNGCNKLMGLSRSSRILENPGGYLQSDGIPGRWQNRSREHGSAVVCGRFRSFSGLVRCRTSVAFAARRDLPYIQYTRVRIKAAHQCQLSIELRNTYTHIHTHTVRNRRCI